MPAKRPKNEAEGRFFDHALASGWEVTKRGWPDFFLEKDGRVIFVEVKPSRWSSLRKEQDRVMQALVALGAECYIWTPDGGFTRVHGPEGDGGKGGPAEEALSLEKQEELPTPLPPESLDQHSPRAEVRAAVACPNCGAPKGSPCVGARGKPREANHAERGRLARGEDPGRLTVESVNRIWGHYVLVMEPRSTLADTGQRTIIREALQVATVDECCRAIDGCKASDWHMGANPGRKKYNKLSSILRGRRGHETTRERIDFFLDYAEKSASGNARFPSANSAVIHQKKTAVQRGARFSDDPERQAEAKEAEAWLKEHGIETTRQEDGYPVFRSLRRDEG